jgi:hypothetical protein
MVRRGGISGFELLFLSLTAASVIGVVVAGLQLIFHLGW